MVDDCGCRKGAIRPCCPRHDPAKRLTLLGQYVEAFRRTGCELVVWLEAHGIPPWGTKS